MSIILSGAVAVFTVVYGSLAPNSWPSDRAYARQHGVQYQSHPTTYNICYTHTHNMYVDLMYVGCSKLANVE